jgi:hypothetical protein
LEQLLREVERVSSNTLVCMESLKNLSTETSRSNTLALDNNYNRVASPQKLSKLESPDSLLQKRKEPSSLYNVSGKKLSLAGKKKERQLLESKSFNRYFSA